jgi:GDP-4-dehydro-6-deoxy-D-mannose reductase
MEKILITGINGFAGSHLADFLLENCENIKIYGTIRIRSDLSNINHIKNYLNLIECNILDSHNVEQVIKKIKPDKIFHFAAQSFVPTSWKSPSDTLSTNILGQSNLLESIRNSSKDSKILIAGSSEEYGHVLPEEIPVAETQPLRPLSPYAVSKVTQDMMAYQYHKSYGLHIIRTRSFNHSGPRRPDFYVDSNFAKQIVEIKLGTKKNLLKHGNLNAIRDFTHVKDIVKGYWMAINNCAAGDVYNICSGKGQKIEKILNNLIKISEFDIKTCTDSERMRPSDVPVLVGDCTKFKTLTNWEPEFTINDILEDTYNYWTDKLS